MKDWKLLIWLTQLGLSTALPLAGFLILGIWLHNTLGWGRWTIWAGLIFGIACSFLGFRDSLLAMEKMSDNKNADESPHDSFHSHE